MTTRPTFYLNSRNRAGNAGLAGDQGAALEHYRAAAAQTTNLAEQRHLAKQAARLKDELESSAPGQVAARGDL